MAASFLYSGNCAGSMVEKEGEEQRSALEMDLQDPSGILQAQRDKQAATAWVRWLAGGIYSTRFVGGSGGRRWEGILWWFLFYRSSSVKCEVMKCEASVKP